MEPVLTPSPSVIDDAAPIINSPTIDENVPTINDTETVESTFNLEELKAACEGRNETAPCYWNITERGDKFEFSNNYLRYSFVGTMKEFNSFRKACK